MSDLKNPMRFTARQRTIDVQQYLGVDKRVTEIEYEPGQIYVHWEETDPQDTDFDGGGRDA